MGTEILRFAQDDKLLPILFVKNHNRHLRHSQSWSLNFFIASLMNFDDQHR